MAQNKFEDHEESGPAVRTIRDWPALFKSRERDDGGIEILYGDQPDSDHYKHGHYGEDANGVTDDRSREPVTKK